MEVVRQVNRMWACVREHGPTLGAWEPGHHQKPLEQKHSKRFHLNLECIDGDAADHLNSCIEEQLGAWFSPGRAVDVKFASY
jgi:hypothetical protein